MSARLVADDATEHGLEYLDHLVLPAIGVFETHFIEETLHLAVVHEVVGHLPEFRADLFVARRPRHAVEIDPPAVFVHELVQVHRVLAATILAGRTHFCADFETLAGHTATLQGRAADGLEQPVGLVAVLRRLADQQRGVRIEVTYLFHHAFDSHDFLGEIRGSCVVRLSNTGKRGNEAQYGQLSHCDSPSFGAFSLSNQS